MAVGQECRSPPKTRGANPTSATKTAISKSQLPSQCSGEFGLAAKAAAAVATRSARRGSPPTTSAAQDTQLDTCLRLHAQASSRKPPAPTTPRSSACVPPALTPHRPGAPKSPVIRSRGLRSAAAAPKSPSVPPPPRLRAASLNSRREKPRPVAVPVAPVPLNDEGGDRRFHGSELGAPPRGASTEAPPRVRSTEGAPPRLRAGSWNSRREKPRPRAVPVAPAPLDDEGGERQFLDSRSTETVHLEDVSEVNFGLKCADVSDSEPASTQAATSPETTKSSLRSGSSSPRKALSAINISESAEEILSPVESSQYPTDCFTSSVSTTDCFTSSVCTIDTSSSIAEESTSLTRQNSSLKRLDGSRPAALIIPKERHSPGTPCLSPHALLSPHSLTETALKKSERLLAELAELGLHEEIGNPGKTAEESCPGTSCPSTPMVFNGLPVRQERNDGTVEVPATFLNLLVETLTKYRNLHAQSASKEKESVDEAEKDAANKAVGHGHGHWPWQLPMAIGHDEVEKDAASKVVTICNAQAPVDNEPEICSQVMRDSRDGIVASTASIWTADSLASTVASLTSPRVSVASPILLDKVQGQFDPKVPRRSSGGSSPAHPSLFNGASAAPAQPPVFFPCSSVSSLSSSDMTGVLRPDQVVRQGSLPPRVQYSPAIIPREILPPALAGQIGCFSPTTCTIEQTVTITTTYHIHPNR